MSEHAVTLSQHIAEAVLKRFGERVNVPEGLTGGEELLRMVEHSSHRKWQARELDADLLALLFSCALSAPSKSDLQQADIVHVEDRARVKAIAQLIPDMPWINDAPIFLVFCGNNRRIRQIGEWRGKPFVNDHLDHFMNAAVDAGIVMTQFIRAAEAVGLVTVPISAVRNHPAQTSEILGLPDAVFPVAGLCVGYPLEPGRIMPRLPTAVTVHVNQFNESGLKEQIDLYDEKRHALFPLRRQRYAKIYPDAAFNGWSEDKARHYSQPERADFGAFIRSKKFTLK
jgi:FMN reductase [NAD(P)H]|uniref:nitroreductase family protein n=1 Tax=Orrella sp. TaxID=1921583 RepID=UPI004047946E